jgi:hypothetical protein
VPGGFAAGHGIVWVAVVGDVERHDGADPALGMEQ